MHMISGSHSPDFASSMIFRTTSSISRSSRSHESWRMSQTRPKASCMASMCSGSRRSSQQLLSRLTRFGHELLVEISSLKASDQGRQRTAPGHPPPLGFFPVRAIPVNQCNSKGEYLRIYMHHILPFPISTPIGARYPTHRRIPGRRHRARARRRRFPWAG
jgi:hypothetical protein